MFRGETLDITYIWFFDKTIDKFFWLNHHLEFFSNKLVSCDPHERMAEIIFGVDFD